MKREGFGGRQPGAGRPCREVVGEGVINIGCDADTVRAIDDLRGKDSRKGYLRKVFVKLENIYTNHKDMKGNDDQTPTHVNPE